MKFFGVKAPFSRACEGHAAPTPLGELCLYCEEPIEQGDFGYIVPYVDTMGTRDVPQHYFCHMRQVTGSLAHVLKLCSCYIKESTENDPVGMSRREAAEVAVREWERQRAAVRILRNQYDEGER